MKLSTFTKLTLGMTLLASLASCGSKNAEETKPQDKQPVTQAAQPEAQPAPAKAQDSQPKTQPGQPQAQAGKAKVQNVDNKNWLLPAMADIGLTAEQEAKIKPIALEARNKFKAVREDATLDSAAKEEKLAPIGKAVFDQYKAILTPEQWKSFLAARKALAEKNKAATPTESKEP